MFPRWKQMFLRWTCWRSLGYTAGDSPRCWPRCLNVQEGVFLLPQNNSLEQQNSNWYGLEEDRNILEAKVASPPSRAALLLPSSTALVFPLPAWWTEYDRGSAFLTRVLGDQASEGIFPAFQPSGKRLRGGKSRECDGARGHPWGHP